MCSRFAGSVKLGHPVPESNFASEENKTFPHARHVYIPFSFDSAYFPVNGASVPFFRRIAYSSGVRVFFHSSSVRSIFLFSSVLLIGVSVPYSFSLYLFLGTAGQVLVP